MESVVKGDIHVSIFPEEVPENTRLFTPGYKCPRNRMSVCNPDYASHICKSTPSHTYSGALVTDTIECEGVSKNVPEFGTASNTPDFGSTCKSGPSYGTACGDRPDVGKNLPAFGIASNTPDFGSSCKSGPSHGTVCGNIPDVIKRTKKGTDVCGIKVSVDACNTDKQNGGLTVFGSPSGQRLSVTSNFPTLGCHNFHFKLQVGQPSRNVVYNGHLDDNGLPIAKPFPYSVLV